MKVSVIVPIYNVEKYLEKCLDSLVNQTLKEIELILVNDGSSDNSDKIIKKYVDKYKNIKYFEKENGGQSSARNYGLKHAKGEYIGFVDSDDYVSLDMYEKMYEKAISDDFDMVACDLNYIYPDKNMVVSCGIKEDTKDINKIYINNYPSVCNKIFKKELFDNLLFKEGVWFEDVEFIYRILSRVKNAGVVHEPFIQYVQREGSVMHSTSSHIYDYVDNMNTVLDYYNDNYLFGSYYKVLEYVYVRYLYATFVRSSLVFPYDDYLKAVDMAIKNVKLHFPRYRRNLYFYRSAKGIYLLIFNKFIAKIMYKLKSRKKFGDHFEN